MSAAKAALAVRRRTKTSIPLGSASRTSSTVAAGRAGTASGCSASWFTHRRTYRTPVAGAPSDADARRRGHHDRGQHDADDLPVGVQPVDDAGLEVLDGAIQPARVA